MDQFDSASFATTVTLGAAVVFALSLIPVLMANQLIERLKLQGRLHSAKTGQGLAGFDRLLFRFHKKCGDGYYLLFFQILFLIVMLGIAPSTYGFIKEEFHTLEAGRTSPVPHNAVIVMAYEQFGARGAVPVAASIIVLAILGCIFGIFVTLQKIKRKEIV